MTTRTSNRGYRISTERDFTDVQGWRDLGLDVDADARGILAEFAGVRDPAAFLFRTTAAIPILNDLTYTIDYDTTGGFNSSGTFVWQQNVVDVESWWMFGFNCNTVNVSGTPSTSERIAAWLAVTSYDPQSSVQNVYAYAGYKLTNDTNTGGEALAIVTVARCYRSTVRAYPSNFGPDTAVRNVAAGARLWGLRLGDA